MATTKNYKFEGKLVIAEKKFEYGVFNNTTDCIKFDSLNDVFMDIYQNSPWGNARVLVKIFDKVTCEYVNVFNMKGELNLNKSCGVWDWFVGKVMGIYKTMDHFTGRKQ